jgi:hypothetical protein
MIRNAIGFWEPLRALYNAALVVLVIVRYVVALPESRRSLEGDTFVALFVMTVIANVLYCAAYALDLPLQHAGFGEHGSRWRWPAFVIGTLFALSLAYFVTGGMFDPTLVG